jgi:sialic acid synthase SpsE
MAIRSIDVAVDCGVDAVKFQTYRAEDLIADPDLLYTYKSANGKMITVSQLEMFKKMELPFDWHRPLMEHSKKKGVQFISSAADMDSVDLLVSLSAPAMKIASEDLINIPVVERIAASGFPAIISTGMADASEINFALEIFAAHKNFQVILLQCTSRYPTPPETCNLNRMRALSHHYGLPVGFSDHTEGCFAAVLAVGTGACIIEKHFTLDQNLPGPDHQMSTEPETFREMVRQIRLAEVCMGKYSLDFDPSEQKLRTQYRRSIVARYPLEAGKVITLDMLAYRRPGGGLKPYEQVKLIGRKLKRSLNKNEIINLSDIV